MIKPRLGGYGVEAILVIGSNQQDASGDHRAANIMSALGFLRSLCPIIEQSGIYETPDCLGKGRKYMNAVVRLRVDGEESDFNAMLKHLEVRMGRTRECRALGIVPLDIDIVVWDGTVRRPADYAAAYFRRGLESLSAGPADEDCVAEGTRLGVGDVAL